MILSNTALVFAPFLLYTSVCLVLALCYPQRHLRHFGVRFGVNAGVLLSLHLIAMWFSAIGGLGGSGRVVIWSFSIVGVMVPFILSVSLLLCRSLLNAPPFWRIRFSSFVPSGCVSHGVGRSL
ncbi:MAG TPA: hypothetical protein VNH11_03365 [Pirellulales bacterium]|nr:hypothetical protein [Pirellulales bacterium]